jgi:hypothetical protein
MLELHNIPKSAQSPLQEEDDLLEDPLDSRRTRYQHEEPSHIFSYFEPMIPMHLYIVQSFDLHIYNEAMGNPLWEETMQKEYDSLLENHTCDLVPLPLGRKLIRCKWVHRPKGATYGQVRKYEERLVAKGFQ